MRFLIRTEIFPDPSVMVTPPLVGSEVGEDMTRHGFILGADGDVMLDLDRRGSASSYLFRSSISHRITS